MPPPPTTAADPWLAARRFGIVVDAGSSGSRLQIYSWQDPTVLLATLGDVVRNSLPDVQKGVQHGQDWITKVEPGLSAFADDPDGVAAYLTPLVEHAKAQIPPSLHAETPLFLLATAGMRLLEPLQQARVLRAACTFLRSASRFRLDSPSEEDGPCGMSVRIITGEEEGLFGWIAVNYLMDGFGVRDEEGGKDKDKDKEEMKDKDKDKETRTTYGFLDMGGASTQIAFEPADGGGEGGKKKGDSTVDVRLRLLGGEEINHRVFVTTWLGYGTNRARERYVVDAIERAELDDDADPFSVQDPCLPRGLVLPDLLSSSSQSAPAIAHRFVGTGSFAQCLQVTAPMLNKEAPCPDTPCLFDGVHVPPIDFSSSHFIGISEYWYSSEHVFGLGGSYDFVQYERAAMEFCGRDWDGIVEQHERSKLHGLLGGDGEVLQDGQVVKTGVWGHNVELSRLQMQCFKAAWIVNVLHEGIGIPRIVDPGGNSSTQGEQVARQAEMKGLGRPVFQSLDSVEGVAISWTLGKMVLEASKEVRPLSSHDRPLVDPAQDIPPTSPIKPIRPPFLDLDVVEKKFLPPALTRQSLGFSPIVLTFYMMLFIFLGCIVFRLRREFRLTFRRIRRSSFDRDLDLDTTCSIDRPSSSPLPSTGLLSSLLRLFRRLTPFSPSPTLPRHRLPVRPHLRHAHSSPSPSSSSSSPSPSLLPSLLPSLSSSSPRMTSSLYQTAYPAFGTSTSSQYHAHSRPSSPVLASFVLDDHHVNGNGMMATGTGTGTGTGAMAVGTIGIGTTTTASAVSGSVTSLSGLARSRNASQLSLNVLTPRQVSLSRPSSVSRMHDDE